MEFLTISSAPAIPGAEGINAKDLKDTKLETFRKGTLIHSPKGIPHCWYNRSDADLSILVLKVPKPTLPTQFV